MNELSAISNLSSVTSSKLKTEKAASANHPSFKDILQEFIDDINELQIKADDLTKRLSTGEISNLHEVMVAAEEASVGLELIVEIRNKILQAYQELIRMPI